MSATMSVSSSQQQNTTNGASNGAIDSQVQVIVNDFMCAQLALKGYQWVPHNEDNLGSIEMDSHRRSRIGESLASLGDEYLRQYNVDFSQMCDRLGLDPNNALSTFTSVANELFVEGIKWNHIVTFLVFGTEFAFYSARNGFPQIVHEVSHWLASYTTNHLLSWINDHGGWEGVIEFARETIGHPQGSKWRFCLRDIICSTAGALGVLTLGLFVITK